MNSRPSPRAAGDSARFLTRHGRGLREADDVTGDLLRVASGKDQETRS